eukprot:NODE_338_length_1611_cov_90.814690_g306_i0.p1 GENE.NODE_338_length_1611_cov_90.814690_g306_i0~~NODE_338_length_1611_cov_90.814690_g306_i0.p1  ORF type:complete len:518 (-),score=81.73 NODE_338_length_1611_cov_90.814690_g306_i0:57-1550(-)
MTTPTLAFHLALLLLIGTQTQAKSPTTRSLPRVHIENGHYVDATGRTLLYHGMNSVRKSEPFYTIITDEEISQMANEWGMNLVRLGISWEGFERSEGVHDMEYLEETLKVAERFAAHGIYVLLDMHQDLFSRKYCGNGFPDWAVNIDPEVEEVAPFPQPVIDDVFELDPETGHIRPEDCAKFPFWGNVYFTNVTGSIYESFYNDVNNVQTRFVETWKIIVDFFAGKEFIVGVEYINEPFPGNIYTNPRLFVIPGYGEKHNLVPMYERLHKEIRQIDDETIIFFEPLVTSTEGLPRKTGFDGGPGGPEYNDRQVYSPHYYCIEGGDPEEEFCEWFATTSFQVRDEEKREWGVGSLLSEWGGLTGNETEDARETTFLAELSDSYLQSWAYWEHNTVLRQPLVQAALSRTYPRATAGTPLALSFDAHTGLFNYQYKIDKSIDLPTEIFARMDVYYPTGFALELDPPDAGEFVYPGSDNLVYIYHNVSSHAETLQVRMQPL